MDWIAFTVSAAFTAANSGVLYWFYIKKKKSHAASLVDLKKNSSDFATHLESYPKKAEVSIRREAELLAKELRSKVGTF